MRAAIALVLVGLVGCGGDKPPAPETREAEPSKSVLSLADDEERRIEDG